MEPSAENMRVCVRKHGFHGQNDVFKVIKVDESISKNYYSIRL